MRERVRVYLAPVGETLMLKLRHYARNARLYLSVTDNGVTLEYTQKILFPPVTHQRRHGSLVATFVLITGRNRTVPDWFESVKLWTGPFSLVSV